MKTLRLIFFILTGIIVLTLVVAAFLPDNITITSSVEINAAPATVYGNVVTLKNWKNWSPFEHDSTMTDRFSGPDSGVGATRQWKGKKMGEGKMTIVEAKPFKLIKNKLDFGPKGGAEGTWKFIPLDSARTKVTWSTHITGLSYPAERLLGAAIRSMMKPMFDNGLKDLKQYTETGKVTPKETTSKKQSNNE
jgi:ribosome-associated toxin RatA of RatAB toxin-antitoxin module